jgi:hypothetical protein
MLVLFVVDREQCLTPSSSMRTFAFQSAPPAAIATSANSTTAPGTETNTVSDTSPACSFFFRQQEVTSHTIILRYDHSPSSPRPPLRPRFGSNRDPPSSEMLPRTTWDIHWLSLRMRRLSWLELHILIMIQDTSKSTA